MSKRLTFELLRYWGDVVGAPVSKFVIANPFGPFEEARFVAHAVETWAKGEAVEVGTPNYLRDNIHVDLLALAYAQFVGEAGAGTRGAAARPLRLHGDARRLRAAPCARTRAPARRRGAGRRSPSSGSFAEPQARINTDLIDAAALGWREDKAWDALAGFTAAAASPAPRPAAEPPPPPAAPAVELRGYLDVARAPNFAAG